MSTSYTGILKGTPYFNGVGLGNTSKVTYSVETEDKDLPDFENPGGGLDDSFSRVKASKLQFAFRRISIKSLELAFGGTAQAVAAGAVADEAHTTGALDELVGLDHVQDMAPALTVKNSAGTVTYDEGTDYVRKRAGIIPLTGGAITAAQDIKISYTKAKHVVVQGLVNLTREGKVTFDGINERNSAAFLGDFHRVKMSPAKNVEFIGDDYISFDCEGTLLKDDTITDPSKSQYYQVKVGSL
ncbi:MAG: hypothetical protein U1E96_08715 [Azonexus sp.]